MLIVSKAQHDPGVRYYNSVAIRVGSLWDFCLKLTKSLHANLSEVKKGEKAVDTKTIEAVAQAFSSAREKTRKTHGKKITTKRHELE